MNLFKKNSYNNIREIIEGCQRNEGKAQCLFYDRYKSKLNGVCQRYAKTVAEAEDIFQEAFVKIFNNIHELKNTEAADAWVKTIVVRTAINYYNGTTKLQNLHDDIHKYDTEFSTEDYQQVIDKMDVEVLLEVINQLPNGYKMIVNMYLVDGYSHVEIAKMLDISEGTSRSQFLRGRNLLLKKLEQKGIIYNESF